MAFYYANARHKVSAISGMVDEDIVYDLTQDDGNFIKGSYILIDGDLVRIASPTRVGVPSGLTVGSIFRVGDLEYRYLGDSPTGRKVVEEFYSNFIARLQMRAPTSSGLSYIDFTDTDFGPSEFVSYSQGEFRLASGLSHTLQAGALSSNGAVNLQWEITGYIEGTGIVPEGTGLVGSVCGNLAAGSLAGNAVMTIIPPSGDVVMKLNSSDPGVEVTNAWAIVSSQYSVQTVSAPPVPSGSPPPPAPTPSGTFNPSGGSPIPSGTPFMGTSYDASGHTSFNITGTEIYVDSVSGSDANPGTMGSPKQTLWAGYLALPGDGNHALYLKAGGTYECNYVDVSSHRWNKKGSSAAAPILIQGYGTGAKARLNWFSAHYPLDYVVFKDLQFDYFSLIKGCNYVLIEDVNTAWAQVNLQGENSGGNWLNPLNNIQLRFCRILDAGIYRTGHRQGLFIVHHNNLVVEFCVFDHNGWPGGEPRTLPEASGGPTIHKHNMYIAGPGGPATIRYNFIMQASSHGIHHRPGGINEWNVFVGNPLTQMGYGGDGYLAYYPNGVSGYIGNNAVITAQDISPSNPRGYAWWINNVDGLTIENNICCFNGTSATNNAFIRRDTSYGAVTQNVTVRNNIALDWATNEIEGGSGINWTITNNDLQGTGVFPDPSGALYYSTPGFISGIRQSGVILGAVENDPVYVVNHVRQLFDFSGNMFP